MHRNDQNEFMNYEVFEINAYTSLYRVNEKNVFGMRKRERERENIKNGQF